MQRPWGRWPKWWMVRMISLSTCHARLCRCPQERDGRLYASKVGHPLDRLPCILYKGRAHPSLDQEGTLLEESSSGHSQYSAPRETGKGRMWSCTTSFSSTSLWWCDWYAHISWSKMHSKECSILDSARWSYLQGSLTGCTSSYFGHVSARTSSTLRAIVHEKCHQLRMGGTHPWERNSRLSLIVLKHVAISTEP